MLEAKNLTYRVGGRELISQVSISFTAGNLHLIIGPNGAGKSTLIKVLSRSLRANEGQVFYDGADISDAKEIDLAKRRAVLSQAVEVAFPLTVREVVMMGRYPHFGGRPAPGDFSIVDEMMDFFDVTEFGDRDYLTLSGGERQRVNFARVLAQLWKTEHQPTSDSRYLFLDEPLTFLDIRHQIEFMKKVQDFASSADVVVVGVVHDLNLAARFGDQVIIIDQGRIVAHGEPANVLTSEQIDHVFGVMSAFIQSPDGGNYIVFN